MKYNGTIDLTGPLSTRWVDLNTVISAPSHAEGRMYYDSTNKTFNLYNDNSSLSLPLGQQVRVKVYNDTGVALPGGKVVSVDGIDGSGFGYAVLADATDDGLRSATTGLVIADIADGAYGYVIMQGLLQNVDTSAVADGLPVWLNTAEPGGITSTEPTENLVSIGTVLTSHATTGTILVNIRVAGSGGNIWYVEESPDMPFPTYNGPRLATNETVNGIIISADTNEATGYAITNENAGNAAYAGIDLVTNVSSNIGGGIYAFGTGYYVTRLQNTTAMWGNQDFEIVTAQQNTEFRIRLGNSASVSFDDVDTDEVFKIESDFQTSFPELTTALINTKGDQSAVHKKYVDDEITAAVSAGVSITTDYIAIGTGTGIAGGSNFQYTSKELRIAESDGGAVGLFIKNTNGTGDAQIKYTVGFNTYVYGIDGTDGKFKLSNSSTLGTSDIYEFDAANAVFSTTLAASNLSGTNTGDQTLISDFTGTKAEFNTALTDGNFIFVGDAPTAHTHPWSEITSTPTTIAGYGITDAYTKTEADGKYLLNTTDTLTGQLTVTSNVVVGTDLYMNTNQKIILSADEDEWAFIYEDHANAEGFGSGAQIYSSFSNSAGHHFIGGDAEGYAPIKADSFVTDGGTSDDILLGDGTSTSLALLATAADLSGYLLNTTDTLTGDLHVTDQLGVGITAAVNTKAHFRLASGDDIRIDSPTGVNPRIYLRNDANDAEAQIRYTSAGLQFQNNSNVDTVNFDTNGNITAVGELTSLGIYSTSAIESEYSNTTVYGATGTHAYTESAIDQIQLINTDNTQGESFTSLYFRHSGDGGNASGRMILTNSNAADSEFRWLLRDSAHTSYTEEKMVLTSDGVLTVNGNQVIDAGNAETELTQFLRSDVADIKTAGNLTFNDNVSLFFGTGNDSSIRFQGSSSIWSLVAGDLFIQDNITTRFTFGRTSGYFYQGNDGGINTQHILYSSVTGKKLQLVSGGTYSTISAGDTSLNFIGLATVFLDETTTEVGRFNSSGDFEAQGDIHLKTNGTYLYADMASSAATRIHGINGSDIEYIGSIDATTASTQIAYNTGSISFINGQATLSSSGTFVATDYEGMWEGIDKPTNWGNSMHSGNSYESATDINTLLQVGESHFLQSNHTNGPVASAGYTWNVAGGDTADRGIRFFATHATDSDLYMKWGTSGNWRQFITTDYQPERTDYYTPLASAASGGNQEHMRTDNSCNFSWSGGSKVGTIAIDLGRSWDNWMGTYEIDLFEYSSNNNTKITVSGYDYTGTPAWLNYGATQVGGSRQLKVRLAHNGTNICILISDIDDTTEATTWQYPRVELTKVTSSLGSDNKFIDDVPTISMITSIAGYGQISDATGAWYGEDEMVIKDNLGKISIKSKSAPSSYYTTLENNYDSSNHFNLISGGHDILGRKTLTVGSAETYLSGYYGISFATGASAIGTGNIRMNITQAGLTGFGTFLPYGLVHIKSGASGQASANASADDFVIEGSTDTGMNILSPDASLSTVRFGSASDNSGAQLAWKYSTKEYTIGTATPSGTIKFTTANSVSAATVDANQVWSFPNSILTGGASAAHGTIWDDYQELTVAALETEGWYKIMSNIGASLEKYTVRIDCIVDNGRGVDEFEIVTGGYNFQHQITQLTASRYNTPKLLEIRTNNPSAGGTIDVWVRLGSFTAGGTVKFWSTQNSFTSTIVKGTEPTWGGKNAQLLFDTTLRQDYSISTTSGIRAKNHLHVQYEDTSPSWSNYADNIATFEGDTSAIITLATDTDGTSEVWFADPASQSAGRLRYEHASNEMELWTNGAKKLGIESDGTSTFTGDVVGNSFNGMHRVTMSLSSAQIKTLNSSPVEIIAAQGAGIAISIVNFTVKYNFITPAYTTAAPSISLLDGGGSQILASTISLLTQTADKLSTGMTTSGIECFENSAVDLYSAADPTLGNGTVDISVVYELIDFN